MAEALDKHVEEVLDRQGALDQLKVMGIKFRINESELAIVRGLILAAKTPEQLKDIIDETAVSHDHISL